MYLNDSSSLEILLGGTVTTNQLDWTADYVDFDTDDLTGTFNPPQATGQTNDTTAQDLAASPASGYTRQVTRFSVQQTDTASATVIIRLNNGSTTRIMWSVALATGDTMTFDIETGLRVTDNTGALKTV